MTGDAGQATAAPSPCAPDTAAWNAGGAKRTQKRKKNRQIISGNFAFNQVNQVSLIQTFKDTMFSQREPTFVSNVHLTLNPFLRERLPLGAGETMGSSIAPSAPHGMRGTCAPQGRAVSCARSLRVSALQPAVCPALSRLRRLRVRLLLLASRAHRGWRPCQSPYGQKSQCH